jgi:hypothetical protein
MEQDYKIFKINVNLGGFLLPLSVKRSTNEQDRLKESPEELVFRKAEKLFNSLLIKNSKAYHQRPVEQVLKLVAFELAVAITKLEDSKDDSILANRIQALDQELKNLIQE